jgi:hypothetical protein
LTIGDVCAPIKDKFPFYLNFFDKFFNQFSGLIDYAKSK